ncbi:MAG: ribbon-helix-helix domain-containing protein, partial [Thermoplasmata archaeon]
MINKDVKLTIRISEDEIKEIDEFLNTNQEFGSRSEFIRHAALEFIGGKRVSLVNDTNEIDMDENSRIIIKTVIEK